MLLTRRMSSGIRRRVPLEACLARQRRCRAAVGRTGRLSEDGIPRKRCPPQRALAFQDDALPPERAPPRTRRAVPPAVHDIAGTPRWSRHRELKAVRLAPAKTPARATRCAIARIDRCGTGRNPAA